jgi:hypothetical protein
MRKNLSCYAEASPFPPRRNRAVDLLFRFLRQNDGTLSRRALEWEFAELTEDEVARIEAIYAEAFSG